MVSCPTEAIYAEADVPSGERPWIDINALWYEAHAAARARIRGLREASSVHRPGTDDPLQNPAALR